MNNATIRRLTATALKRFGGICSSLEAKRQGSGNLFEFTVAGANTMLEVDLGGDFRPTKVRSAFVALGWKLRG